METLNIKLVAHGVVLDKVVISDQLSLGSFLGSKLRHFFEDGSARLRSNV